MRKNYSLLPSERADARAALEMLSGSGLSLTEAASLAIGRAASAQRTSLEAAFEAFLRNCIKRNLRPTSVNFYESKLATLCAAFPNAFLDDFKRPELRTWIEGQGAAQSTTEGYLRAVRALFRWARRQDPPLCIEDPTLGLTLDVIMDERLVEIFKPKEAKAILSVAGTYKAAAVLMLFAGVRPGEINSSTKPSLLWRHIDFKARSILIPAHIAKTRVARLLEKLPDNLWLWLKLLRGAPDDPICERQLVGMSRAILRDAKGLHRWVHDGCRHSFATYHVSHFESTEKTSLILGHEGRVSLLHKNYRGLCSTAEAKAFFGIVPA
jgi:integrase